MLAMKKSAIVLKYYDKRLLICIFTCSRIFMTDQTIIIILQVLIVIIGLYLAFFKSYLQEKGKNIATKEDIEEITKKVEAVKTEFQILTHSRTTLNSEKRNSFLNYYDKYFLWLNTLLDTSYGNIDYYKNEEIDKYITKLNAMYKDICNAEARMQLWNDDEELTSLTQTLKVETLEKLHNVCKDSLLDLKGINLKLEERNSAPVDYRGPLQPILDELHTGQKKYSAKLINNYTKLVEKTHELIDKSREYLLTIN